MAVVDSHILSTRKVTYKLATLSFSILFVGLKSSAFNVDGLVLLSTLTSLILRQLIFAMVYANQREHSGSLLGFRFSFADPIHRSITTELCRAEYFAREMS